MHGGNVAEPAMIGYAKSQKSAASSTIFDQELKLQRESFDKIFKMNGPENAFALWRELGDIMTENVTVVRHNKKLKETDDKLLRVQGALGPDRTNDNGKWANQEVLFVRQLWNMLELSRPMTLGALNRNESRGAHYKPEFPERDDENFMKTTMAAWSSDGPRFSWEPVDVSLIKPRPRRYDVDKSARRAEGGVGAAGEHRSGRTDPGLKNQAAGIAELRALLRGVRDTVFRAITISSRC